MSEMSREKAIKLAKKLKALADRGIDGEKDNAREKLNAFLKEHDLEEYQISEGLRTFERTTLNEGSVILERLIKAVSPNAKIMVKQVKTKLIIEVTLTSIEYREIRQKYKFFWRAYNRERKLLLTSFFNKHISFFTATPEWHNNTAQKPEQQPTPSPSPSSSGQPSGAPNPNGFRGRQLTDHEEMKVRYYMKLVSPLDYERIQDIKVKDDDDNSGDMSPNQ